MMNNSYYVLSEQYKRDQNIKVQAAKKNVKMCVVCHNEPQDVYYGDFKGWCKSCKDLDLWISDWSEACWEESTKDNPNPEVYKGKF